MAQSYGRILLIPVIQGKLFVGSGVISYVHCPVARVDGYESEELGDMAPRNEMIRRANTTRPVSQAEFEIAACSRLSRLFQAEAKRCVDVFAMAIRDPSRGSKARGRFGPSAFVLFERFVPKSGIVLPSGFT